MPDAPYGQPINWLTVAQVDPAAAGTDREALRLALEAHDIEARPAWKPLHLQPLFAGHERVGGAVAERIFDHGLCLPSGSSLTRRRPGPRHRGAGRPPAGMSPRRLAEPGATKAKPARAEPLDR